MVLMPKSGLCLAFSLSRRPLARRNVSSAPKTTSCPDIVAQGRSYKRDEWTNVTPKILSYMDRKLHLRPKHPLGLIKQRIVQYMYKKYSQSRGNPLFSVHENLCPIVSLEQNFDSLLVAGDHPSRKKSDSYYLNKDVMLRAHTSAHQVELLRMGLDNFLVIGDVYRRDTIDRSHFPAFHQVEGVRTLDRESFAGNFMRPGSGNVRLFEADHGFRTDEKQETHTMDTAKMLEIDLKDCLSGMAKDLFGPDIEYRWVDAYFPFTHPSWELEVFYRDEWMECLGCGIVEQAIMANSGVGNKVGWAFGLGLERLAMKLYQIPDIKLFWSQDPGFHIQFDTDDPNKPITYKPVSKYPSSNFDVSFWIPEGFSANDFYDIVRSIGDDMVEYVELIDEFYHPKKKLSSHCYRITYRHLERTLTKEEIGVVHSQIEREAVEKLSVTIR